MFLGRFNRGEIVPLIFPTPNGSDVPTAPDAVPSAMIYGDSGIVKGVRVPAHDQLQNTGLFLYPLFLDATFAAGRYRVVFCYAVTDTFHSLAEFEVTSAGDPDGAAIGLAMFDAPSGADFAVAHLQSGRVKKMRNPRPL